MKIALAHNHFDQEKLNEVVAEMKVLGAPSIAVLDLGFDGMVQALEGCHRLRACEILNITPVLVWKEESDQIMEEGELLNVSEIGDYENYFIGISASTGLIEIDEEEKLYC